MYLSNLNIVGFKSFAQKTNLKFTDGLTAIVGPNGCGKTNIVDALRWALGEQKTTVLRSDIMEDVIFNGTSKRKPLSMAEVALTLQNNKGILPTEYTEVTVTRRLFRDGSSQYFLNNTHCRLKDILDLFMDTGMGSDSYSVIELKMVEAILSGKPEERRHLLEEAAGVKKYKQRRKEANRKLAAIQSDLLRVNDIVAEVEKQVGTLSRQAAKTRRYNKLTEELRSLEVNLLYHQYEDYNSKLTVINSDIKELSGNKHNKEINLNQHETLLVNLKEQLSEKDSLFNELYRNETDLSSQVAQVSQDIAVSNERLHSLNNTQERIKNELKEYDTAYDDLEKQQLSVNNSISLIKDKQINLDSELELAKETVNSVKSTVSKAREDSGFTNEEVITIQNEINSINSEINKGKNRKDSLNNSIIDSENEIKNLEQKLSYAKSEHDAEFEKTKDFDARINDIEATYQTSQEQKQSLQNEIDNVKDDISNLKNDLNSNRSSLEFLNSLIDSDESTSHLLNETNWETAEPKTLFAELLGTDEKYRTAVGAALGTFTKCFVVQNKQEAEIAINSLNENDKGKASFIIKEQIPESISNSQSQSIDGVFGSVPELVRTDNKLKSALQILLGNTLICENIEIANSIVEQSLCDTAVTLNGDIVKSKFYLRAGSAIQNEGIYVGKQERIDKLNSEITELQSKLEILEQNLLNLKEHHDAIDLIDLNNKLRTAQNEKTTHLQIVSQKQYIVEGIEQNISVLNKNNEMFIKEIQEIEQEISNSSAKLTELEASYNRAVEVQKSKSSELQQLEQELAEKEEEFKEVQMKSYRYTQEVISLQRDIESLNSRKINLQQTEERRKEEIAENDSEIENIKFSLKDLENKHNELKEKHNDVLTNKEFVSTDIKSVKNEINQQSEELSHIRKELEKILSDIHQKEITNSQLNTKLDAVKQRAAETYEMDLETAEINVEEEFSIDETKDEVNHIKDKLSRLGNVNFMALEEFETQSERLQFYQNQVQDLVEAEKNLIQTIDEINETAQAKFIETFEVVNKNFQHLFKTLFREDAESDLRLTPGDPLESDVEIMAKPPGKKPRNIEALSGGEKTLTAIALLFAIYLVKPSPFCILDEVDAPLDDANIDRYIKLIRDFSNDTQFLIVTHNKRTMEAADSLYGVTMEEEGVSKLVSVKLSEDINSKNEIPQ